MEDRDSILLALGRIEGRLVEISTLPGRVRSLENWRAWMLGGMACIGALLAILVQRVW